jgi:hypothetical protein
MGGYGYWLTGESVGGRGAEHKIDSALKASAELPITVLDALSTGAGAPGRSRVRDRREVM